MVPKTTIKKASCLFMYIHPHFPPTICSLRCIKFSFHYCVRFYLQTFFIIPKSKFVLNYLPWKKPTFHPILEVFHIVQSYFMEFLSPPYGNTFKKSLMDNTLIKRIIIVILMSFAYCDKICCWPIFGTLIPTTSTILVACFTIAFKTSPTMKNKYGASGHPYYILNWILNVLEIEALKHINASIFWKSN